MLGASASFESSGRAQDLLPSGVSRETGDAVAPSRTSTTAGAIDRELADEARPESGVGSLISPEESSPLPPPSAQEIEAASEFEASLELREAELRRYEAGATGFVSDLQDQIRVQYEAQKDSLALQFDRAIEKLEEEERSRRLEAIERFEAFIRKYPDDPRYTPDAMFRLAELYFERSSDEFLQASRRYEDELLAYEQGRRPTEPIPPEPNYEQTIALHQRLLSQFPSYRLADAARYLLGYSYSEQGQPDEALVAYLALTEAHPTSSFSPRSGRESARSTSTETTSRRSRTRSTPTPA
ncbi:MAG: tetratricopeptide repeat protein [Myxococcales bacterium]|nr:tetratricopeptide repeat protein [Myxococcales bacterium]